MKTNFAKDLDKVENSVVKYIKKSVKKNKEVYLVDVDDSGSIIEFDELYNLPIAFDVSKHGFYCEYGIFKIENSEGNIFLHGQEKGENSDERTFLLEEVEVSQLCYLADLISKKI